MDANEAADAAPTPQEPIKDEAAGESAPSAVSPLQKELGLAPPTVVLAKVKGYRAWPAMILDEAILPENIRQMKPKTVRLAKKPTTPVIMVPVRFFSDDTYIWLKSCDLKILERDAIDAFLAKKPTSKTLVAAYRLAKNPPDMAEFNRWGSAGPPDPDAAAPVADSPPRKKLKLSLRLKNPPRPKPQPRVDTADDDDDGDDDDDDDASGSSGSDSAADDMSGYDSDWGLDGAGYNFAAGDYIFDDEAEQADFVRTFPRAAEVVRSWETHHGRFAQLHRTLSPALLREPFGDEKHVLAQLKAVHALVAHADTPLVAFLKSPLYRVLLLTAHKPAEVFPHGAVRAAILRVFAVLGLDVCEVKLEDLEMPQEEATPEANNPAVHSPDGTNSANNPAPNCADNRANGPEHAVPAPAGGSPNGTAPEPAAA